MQRLINEEQLIRGRSQAEIYESVGYTVVVAVLMGIVFSFLATRISPIFVQILEEFDLPPGVYNSVWAPHFFVSVTSHFADYGYLWAFGFSVIMLLVFSRRGRRFARHLVAREKRGTVDSLHSAQLLNLLADSVDEGRPLAGSLSTLARYHFDKNVRQRLLLARNEIEQGADAWKSLADAKLFTRGESLGLAMLSANDSKVWAMRRLATWKRDHFSARIERMIAFVQPAIVLFFAAFVLFAAYSMFQFLAELDNNLSQPWIDT